MLRSVFTSFGAFLILSILIALWVYHNALQVELANDREAGNVRLSEAISRLRGQLDVYRALVNITARDQKTARAFDPDSDVDIDTELSNLSLTYGAWEIDLINPAGTVLVSSAIWHQDFTHSGSLVRAAMNERLGYAIEIENGQRLIRFSRGVKKSRSDNIGAVVVSANLAALEFEWPVTPEPIVFFDRQGISISANRSELLLLSNVKNLEKTSFPLQESHGIMSDGLWVFTHGNNQISEVQIIRSDVPQLQLTGQVLLDTSGARHAAFLRMGLAAALMAALGLIAAIFVQQRYRLALESRHSRTLEQSVEKRTAQLKATQNELVEASNLAALGRLSAGLSHELNQPLAAILNFAENGKQFIERAQTLEAANNLSLIVDQIRRITRIIGNLRAFARQEKIASDLVDLTKITGKALDLMTDETLRAAITIKTKIPDQPVLVMAGKVRLEQVVVNLVSNAIDAMQTSSKKELVIKLQHDDLHTVLSIQDTGSGIKNPERVFEPFYTTKELGASKGLGMGLALSFGLVASFGGHLSCRNLEHGAEFTMRLPLARRDDD